MNKKPGFLLLHGLIILMLITMTVLGVSKLITTQNYTNAQLVEYIQAKYIAQAGLQRAQFALITAPATEKISCPTLSTIFSALDFGGGNFKLSCVTEHSTQAHLTSNIGNNNTAISADSTTGYSQWGYLKIDDEIIYYADQTATAFLEVKRGFAGTVPAAHLIGSRVTQSQGNVTSIGSMPNGVEHHLNDRLPLFEQTPAGSAAN